MRLRTSLCCALLLLFSTSAYAQDDKRAEARERFDRGLQLFNENDNTGALAEFKRTYELIPNPLVLYNIGLVYAAMGRSVEAVAALDTVIANPGPVTGDRLARAKSTRDVHAKRIAALTVKTNVPAAIEVDNLEVGRTTDHDLELKVTGGSHIIGAIALGHAPLRKEVTIAGEEKRDIVMDLVPIEGKVAHLTLKTRLPGADVVIDDKRIGQTPLAPSLSLAPGQHSVEVRRTGYSTARQDITLGDGAVAEIVLDPTEDRAAIEREGGTMALEASESQVVVTVDGQTRGVYLAPFKLAGGTHHLLLERGGFMSMDRDIVIAPAQVTTVRARLEPTPETRAEVSGRAGTVRTIAWVATLGGAAIAIGGGIFLGANASKKSDAQAVFDQKNGALANHTGICDTANGGDAAQCNADAMTAKTKLDEARSRDTIGIVGLVAGGVLIGGGIVLFVLGDNPHKYDRTVEIAKAVQPWIGANGGGLRVNARF